MSLINQKIDELKQIFSDHYNNFFFLLFTTYFALAETNAIKEFLELIFNGRTFITQFLVFLVYLFCIRFDDTLGKYLKHFVEQMGIRLYLLHGILFIYMAYELIIRIFKIDILSHFLFL